MFKSILTVACAGALFFAPSIASALTDVWNFFYADDYEASISDTSMLYLSVESFQGPWGDVLKSTMDITDNKVPGWKYLAGDTKGKEAFSWVLWQNQYVKTTYALSCAGTDSPYDVATFLPMMVDEDYSQQMRDAIDTLQDIKDMVPTDIKKLYITGHSLGGYLAMFLGTEVVDAYNNQSAFGLTFDSIFGAKGSSLTMDPEDPDVKAVTFGAPGFYKTTIKFASDLVDVLQSKGVTIYDGGVRAPSWSQTKFNRDAAGKYKDYVINYKNSYDPVANLFIAPSAFVHVGTTKNIDVTKPNILEAQIRWALNKIPVVNYGYRIANILYHTPTVYLDMVESQKYN